MIKRRHHPVVQYLINILVSIDQFFNALFLGDPDETISSRLGKWTLDSEIDSTRRRIAYGICRALHWIDEGHCVRFIEEDEGSNAVIRESKK